MTLITPEQTHPRIGTGLDYVEAVSPAVPHKTFGRLEPAKVNATCQVTHSSGVLLILPVIPPPLP